MPYIIQDKKTKEYFNNIDCEDWGPLKVKAMKFPCEESAQRVIDNLWRNMKEQTAIVRV